MAFFFRPKLVDSLQGYTREQLGADIAAGITVGVVALPLAMAFAIASGLKPEAGLFTAIIAGFIISALGGSKVQIGGPAGAFIVIVYGILERYGLPNLILATAASGVLLFVMGLLKLGTLIRFIPVAVVIGFTNGIAVRDIGGSYQVAGQGAVVRYVREPFQREPDFGASSVNYEWKELWERGDTPLPIEAIHKEETYECP